MYPCIEIKPDGILHNIKILKSLCAEHGISFALVTKVLVGYEPLVSYLVGEGKIEIICDSRVENFKEFVDIKAQKWLIRSPMLSQAEDAVKFADVSLNSELEIIKALNEEADRQHKRHGVILMFECGDLREGCYEDELIRIVGECLKMQNIELLGIGTNLSCLNDVLPSEENMARFENAVNAVQEHLAIKFPIISGGASSSVKMLCENALPSIINNMRMGEAAYLGNIPCYDIPFDGARVDNFILKAEIIELKEKPSTPDTCLKEGEKLMKRALVAIGKQDIYLPGLSCVDERIKVIGGSSDHVVLDMGECGGDYTLGSVVEFKMSYNCLLNAMTSKYVKKIIQK